MKNIIYIAFCFGIYLSSFAQEKQQEKLFSVQMRTHFKKYAQQADFAYQTKNYKAADTLFRHFINTNLINTKFIDFKAKNLNGSLINIETYFKKPVILITYSSWCVRSENEITKLNSLAKELNKKIDFVVLFWDDYNTARKSAKAFNKYITVLYINERENTFAKEVGTLKQTLGYPLTLYVNNENKIVDITKKTPSYKIYTGNTTNTYFQNGLSALLVNAETSPTDGIAKK